MKEDLLQYIWQYQLFDKQTLLTEDGQSLNILRAGNWNRESGPDFLQAQIKIGEMIWFGSVEIHILARDWKNHKHHLDPAFENVILHVVWDGKNSVQHQDGTNIPTFILKDRVGPLLLKKYQNLLEKKNQNQLACSNDLHTISSLHKLSVLEKAALNRLERKSEEVKRYWIQQEKNWQQTAFQWICRAYGFKVNADAFATLGTRLSYQQIQKERSSFENVVALLFEFSGLNTEKHASSLTIEMGRHLSQKYSLKDITMQPHEFRWSRLRPANFPEVRLIQLAALLYQQSNLLDFLLHLESIEDILSVFDNANQNFKANTKGFSKAGILGKESMYNIMINAIAPFRFAFGIHNNEGQMKENAVNLLQSIPAEKNRITKIFHQYNFPLKTALESQGVLEQYYFACQKKRCLQCPIGVTVMKNHDLMVN